MGGGGGGGGEGGWGIRLHYILNSMHLLIITSAMFSSNSQFNHNEFLYIGTNQRKFPIYSLT